MTQVKGGNDAAATTPQDRVDAETARPSQSAPSTQFDAAKFTDRQRDGFACIRCHAEDKPMVPVGSTSCGQVFACRSHITESTLTAIEDAVALNPTPALSGRDASMIFKLGCASSVILADELGMDVRDLGIRDVEDLLSAQEVNELVLFIRALVGKRQAGTA